jgi:hypothetical protein
MENKLKPRSSETSPMEYLRKTTYHLPEKYYNIAKISTK